MYAQHNKDSNGNHNSKPAECSDIPTPPPRYHQHNHSNTTAVDSPSCHRPWRRASPLRAVHPNDQTSESQQTTTSASELIDLFESGHRVHRSGTELSCHSNTSSSVSSNSSSNRRPPPSPVSSLASEPSLSGGGGTLRHQVPVPFRGTTPPTTPRQEGVRTLVSGDFGDSSEAQTPPRSLGGRVTQSPTSNKAHYRSNHLASSHDSGAIVSNQKGTSASSVVQSGRAPLSPRNSKTRPSKPKSLYSSPPVGRVQSARSCDPYGYPSSRGYGSGHELQGLLASSPTLPPRSIAPEGSLILQQPSSEGLLTELRRRESELANMRATMERNEMAMVRAHQESTRQLENEICLLRERGNKLEATAVEAGRRVAKAETSSAEAQHEAQRWATEAASLSSDLETCEIRCSELENALKEASGALDSLTRELVAKRKCSVGNKQTQTVSWSTISTPPHSPQISGNTESKIVTQLRQELRRQTAEFHKERKDWLTEKSKVIAYQKQLQANHQQLDCKTQHLEKELHSLTLELAKKDKILLASAYSTAQQKLLIERPPPIPCHKRSITGITSSSEDSGHVPHNGMESCEEISC